MVFEDEFPSLNGYQGMVITGEQVPFDVSDHYIEVMKLEDPTVFNVDIPVLPKSAVQNHCIDKQRVREIRDYVLSLRDDIPEDDDSILANYLDGIIGKMKELGL